MFKRQKTATSLCCSIDKSHFDNPCAISANSNLTIYIPNHRSHRCMIQHCCPHCCRQCPLHPYPLCPLRPLHTCPLHSCPPPCPLLPCSCLPTLVALALLDKQPGTLLYTHPRKEKTLFSQFSRTMKSAMFSTWSIHRSNSIVQEISHVQD